MNAIGAVQNFFKKVAGSRQIQKKIFVTLGIFLVARVLTAVPVPGINTARLSELFANNQFLGLLNIFAGGTLATFSIVAIGVSPYITSSIVFQLLGMVFPKLKDLQKDGERGKAKLNQYTRLLSLPVAIIQSISMIAMMSSQGLLTTSDLMSVITIVVTLVTGAFIMLWLGELIGTYGLGNGVSMIMTLGIISQFPGMIFRFVQAAPSFGLAQALMSVGVLVGVIAVVWLVVVINEAVRNVPIQYAKRIYGTRVSGGQSTYFPVKVNSVGVMPIIFAITLVSLPSFLGQILSSVANPGVSNFGQQLMVLFNQNGWFYMVFYFVVVFVFSYFSSMIFFNTGDIADELKKSGAFVPGVRPGGQTKDFLSAVVKRLTFIAAIFLGSIAVLPFLLQRITGAGSLAIGGTSILILVSVLLEMNKTLDGMAVGQNYDRYE